MVASQKIFAIARPVEGVSWRDMAPLMQAEAAHVWSHYERGAIRAAWIRTDALGAVYSLESTPNDASELLAGLPVACHGLVTFELIPVGPFTPLSLLFGTQAHVIRPAAPCAAGITQPVLAIDCPRSTLTPVDGAAALLEDVRHAWALWKAGVIRENYARTDRPGVALVLEACGKEHARGILGELPLVRDGVIEFECLALAAFVGFDALLDGSLDDIPEQLVDPTHKHEDIRNES